MKFIIALVFCSLAFIESSSAQRRCRFEPPWRLKVRSEPAEDNGRICSIRNRYFYEDTGDFHYHTAAECFFYTHAKLLKRRPCLAIPFVCLNGDALSFEEGECHLPHSDNSTYSLHQVIKKIKGDELRWLSCVTNAMEYERTDRFTCGRVLPSTWDGLTCFDDTPAGTNVSLVCPSYIYPKPPKCSYYLSRQCRSDGTWFKRPNQSEEYTNYGGCMSKEKEGDIVGVFYFAIALFSLSVIFCVPAIIIFSSFHALQCQRISMHKNLVLSVMLSSLMQLIDLSVITIPQVTKSRGFQGDENFWWCKLLLVLQKYFWCSQFTWMLCEGFYLYMLVSQAFVGYSTLAKYYAFGWGMPAVLVKVYAIATAIFADVKCWRGITIYDYVITCPATVCLLLNVFFMVRVILVIIRKLQSPDNSDNSQENNLKRVLRAVLILIPLFGLHYVVSIVTSGAVCANKLLVSYISWFCVSSQGVFVSLVLCYMNSEVQYHLKKTYYRLTDQRQLDVVMRKPSADARMSMITVNSDASSGLLHRASIV